MNNVKNVFSIKDLENFSGIKAHTIRIWEKRYNILEPMRTETNIRYYDLTSLQKLLNITLLHNYGYKISVISKYSDAKLPLMVNELVSNNSAKNQAINTFKIAMMNFDQPLFLKTYTNFLLEKSFSDIFNSIFVPLLGEIGVLWQTNTITPAHEHFISYLIKQKILINTEKIQTKEPTKTDKVFVLYLPLNEIHELGLMYLNYEIILSGYKTIYLGESVPVENLKDLKKYFDKIVYVTYFTVEPNKFEIDNYIQKVNNEILNDNSELWILGRLIEYIDDTKINSKTTIHHSLTEIINKL